MAKFFRSIFLLTIFLIGAQFLVFDLLELTFIPIYASFYVILFGITLLSHKMLVNLKGKRPQLFVTYFMGAMTLKLFASLILMLIVLWFNREIKIQLATVFMILYLAYTAFSIISLLPHLKNTSK